MNAIELIKSLPANRAEINLSADAIVQMYKNGLNDVLELEIKMKILEEIISAVRTHEDVKRIVMTEADKWTPNGGYTKDGIMLTIGKKTTYKYDNDIVISQLKEKVKQREAMLKLIKPGMTVADAETGEVLSPIDKTETHYIKIQFPKF